MAAVFPALEQVGEIAIKLAGLLTRFALRKPASSKPTLHRTGTYSYLPGNGSLAHAEFAQSDHLLIMGQTFLAPSLLKTLQLWGGSGRPFRLPNRCLRIYRGLHLTFALSRQMMCQKPFQSLSQIFEEVESVRTLKSLRSTLPSRRGIFASTIPADCHQVKLLAHPGCRGFRLPIG